MKFTEDQIKLYSAPLSDTENQKCLNAIRAIRDALKKLGYSTDSEVQPIETDTFAYSTTLRKSYSDEKIQIFIQGSYANNTCVRGESDVDIAIVRLDQYEYAFGKVYAPTSYSKKVEGKIFKDTVEKTLREYFPYCVTRKNKSIKVDGNTYRKQADSVPCFAMHYYNNSESNDFLNFLEGVTIYADDGTIINNFPKQHISNGKRKNASTSYRYKKMVRVIKKLRYMMEDYGYSSAKSVSSFGLESLLWNIPDEVFMKYSSYRFVFDDIVDYLVNHQSSLCIYKEANGIKYLCPSVEMNAAYARFINDLRRFYEWA